MAKVALLIGVSEYESGLAPLPAAIQDIEAMKQVFGNPGMGGFDEVTSLINPERSAMEVAIEKLFSDCQNDDLLLLYYSGHGIKDDSRRLYFANSKTRKTERGELSRATAVSASFIHESMERSRSKRQVLVLDCCFSGSFARGMTVKADSSSFDIQGQLGGEGRVVLASSASTEYSFQKDDSELSIYTRYLVEGIKTGAADSDNDGWITVEEWHEYARNKIKMSAPAMNPQIIAVREGYKILIAKAPVSDPELRYRKEFERNIADRGEISTTNRRVLDVLQKQLGLQREVALEIESEVLKPFQEHQEKLRQYKQVFSEEIQKENPLSQATLDDLKHYQEVLGLRDEDIALIQTNQTNSDEDKYSLETEVSESESKLSNSNQTSVFKIGGLRGAGNDLVAAEDQLGFKYYVAAFADLIESPYTQPPLTIGIFGSWGMGKSFLLEHITRELNQRYQNRRQKREASTSSTIPRVHVVEFNAWEYSCAEVIWPGLVRKIMNRLEIEVSWGFPGRFLIKLGRNLKHQLKQARGQLIGISAIVAGLCFLGVLKFQLDLKLIWGAIVALGISGIFKIVGDTLSKPLSQWITTLFQERNYGKQIGYMAEIRSDLEFLATRLKKDNARILVIIDDLDRCEPQKAVEVLQAVKLLLNFDSFIVSLGIDARIITRAVEEHYKSMLGPVGASGYEYLDKIVQIPFRIPQPSPEELKVFIARQLFPDEKDEPSPFEKIELINERNVEPQEFESQKDSFFTSILSVSPDTINLLVEFLKEHFGDQRIQLEVEADGKKLKVKADNATELQVALEAAQKFLDMKQNSIGLQGNSLDQPRSLVAFTYDELEAFQSLTRFLRPNPRHLKRLVNIYRLVRSLAEYKNEQIILSNPVATIRWLVMCGQWPYTSHAMLWYFDEMLEAQEEGQLIEFPSGDPLAYLLEEVKLQLSQEKQSKLDDDPDLLRMLIKRQEGSLGWEQLKIIRQYTVNFNPAVEAELKSEVPVKLNNRGIG
jgi:Cdc6-like AAA superfamily ATPase